MSGVMDGVDLRTQLVGRNRMELLLFRLVTGQRFGINVFKVREVIRCPQLTALPQSHSVVRGVANIRGSTMSVIDLGAAVGLPPIDDVAEKFTIVAEFNRNLLGFLVSSVDRIVNVQWQQVKPAPKGVGIRNYLTAVLDIDEELVQIIDVERVLADVVGFNDIVDAQFIDQATTAKIGCRHVLFADDSVLARKQIQAILDQLGMTYIMAQNGREAHEILQTMLAESDQPIDQRLALVISDVEMPEMDGYTLTKLIKEHPQLKRLYVCLHTSLSGNFNHAMAAKVGADKLVSKFVANELAEIIANVVNQPAAPIAA